MVKMVNFMLSFATNFRNQTGKWMDSQEAVEAVCSIWSLPQFEAVHEHSPVRATRGYRCSPSSWRFLQHSVMVKARLHLNAD